LWAENQAVADALKLLRIRKKQEANARELFLSQFLSERFMDHFNNRCDPIVSALVGVAMNLENGPDAVTIRGRRRGQRKISSKK
jgi:hypothetical protein